MSCSKCKKNLVALLDGELDSALTTDLRDHLAGCASCQGELAKLDGTLEAMARHRAPPPSPSFDSDFARRLRLAKAEREEKPKRARRFWMFGGFAGAAAAAAIALFALGVWRNGPTAPAKVAEIELAQNLELLENYDVVSSLDALEDFEIVSNLDSLLEEEG